MLHSSFKHAVVLSFFLFPFLFPVYAQQQKENNPLLLSRKQSGSFPLVAGGKAATVCFDATEERVVKIAAQAVGNDVRFVTGIAPAVDSSDALPSYCVIIGTIGKSKRIDALIAAGKLNASKTKGQWETFSLSVIDAPFANVKQTLVIAGSDARGTAFGAFELSKMMGVQPFYWWADITPEHKQELFVTKGEYTSKPPSVKYRGIFLNDEDWGLQPWAAKTFEPETGDIGPKTYAKIFELLLRLKANLIWPAMHPSTKAFFHYPANPQVAADYAIVVGSSHAEPMLRNNVGEWNEKTMGHFNYVSNRDSVYNYWEGRVKQSAGVNAIYTMGMRGVHDSKMEGVKDEKEAVPLLERIIADQRGLLNKYVAKDVTAVPQVFTAYKEVLEIYDAGLKLPEDITLVWPDDNYGYIQRLTNKKEQSRTGGSGVYYHASYWGRPHDYLWLSSTHPSLVREEMMKAYETGANKLWVLNVGDLKPLEYNTEQFLDMAYNVSPFKDSRYTNTHLTAWASTIFGKEAAPKIKNILWQYYQLAFERKPEFMGWSQTEPTTKTFFTTYNHFYYGDEARRRLDAYTELEGKVKALKNKIGQERSDAFYELVYYPVMGASWLNKKFLYRDKAFFYAKQNRLSANEYAALSKAAYDSIAMETEYFNTKLAGAKWNGMMSMKPRDLPVFKEAELTAFSIEGASDWSIAPEGFVRKDSSLLKAGTMTLPAFDDVNKQRFFIDVFLCNKEVVSWSVKAAPSWIKLSQSKGILLPEAGKNEVRIWVEVDWRKMTGEAPLSSRIVFNGSGKEIVLDVQARKLKSGALSDYKGFVENNGFVSIHAANFSTKTGKEIQQWQVVDGLGYAGKVLQATGDSSFADSKAIVNNNASAAYDFYTFTGAPAEVSVFTLPTHPLNNQCSMRYAVCIDEGPITILDFKTFGRSEEWKQNVLSNRAERKARFPFLKAGSHTLKIFAVDPGVALDEIRIDLGGLKKAYGMIPETKMR